MVYEKLVQILNRKLDLSLVTMTSLDCMSVGYFLKCFLRNSRKIILNLSNCSINGHSIGLIIGEHSSAGASPDGMLITRPSSLSVLLLTHSPIFLVCCLDEWMTSIMSSTPLSCLL